MMTQEELEWASGFVDGEGCWTVAGSKKYPVPEFKLKNTDYDVMEHLSVLLELPVKEVAGRQGEKRVYQIRSAKESLRVGYKLSPWLSQTRRNKIFSLGGELQPKENDTLPWFCGLMEAEGSFVLRPYKGNSVDVKLKMTDLELVRRAKDFVGAGSINRDSYFDNNPNWKPQYCFRIPIECALSLLPEMLPHMGERRSAKIQQILTARGF